MRARLGGTGDKCWRHSVASTECGRHLSARAQWPAEPWQGSGALRSANLRRHRRQQGGRRSSSTPSSWRAQASPTRPEQPSLASVGGGMAAEAAIGTSRAADAWVRPRDSTFWNVNVQMTGATSLQHCHRACLLCNRIYYGAGTQDVPLHAQRLLRFASDFDGRWRSSRG